LSSLDLSSLGLKHLNAIDLGVIAVYAVIVVGIGIYLQRRASRSLEDYFLAGKQLPWWALGVSGMLAFLDMTGTMLIVSFLYMLGPRGLYIEFRGGAVLVLAFMMLWTGKWHYRSQVLTGAEWYVYRFGTGAGAQAARVITAVAAMIFTFSMLAYLIQGAGSFLAMFLPFDPKVCALLMILLTVAYTLLSGFYGVVYTDLFQSFIVLISVVIITVMGVVQVSHYDGSLEALAQQVTGVTHWTSSVPNWQVDMPKGYDQYHLLFAFAFLALFKNILGGMGMSGADPRYFGARSERECGLLSFFWTWLMTFRWPMMMAFAVMGIFLVHELFPDTGTLNESSRLIKQHYVQQAFPGDAGAIDDPKKVEKAIPKSKWEDSLTTVIKNQDKYPELVSSLKRTLGEKDWESKLDLVGYEGSVNPERILPAVILMRIPVGLRGLFLISLVAAAMSTFSPTVNGTTALFTKDIYQAFIHPKASNPEMIAASWGFGIILTAGGFLMAYWTASINQIWDWIILGLTAGLAIPGLLRLYWWRFNAGGVVGGTFIGIVGAVIQHVLNPDMNPYYKFTLNSGIALFGAILGTYLTAPADPKIVEFFYKTTRPFGFWGPFKRKLHPETRRKMEREHFYDLAALPFALLWQITLFLLPMQFIIRDWRSFSVTLVIFVFSLVILLRLWYRNLPPADKRLPTIEEIDSGNI
jgi:solute:Na+ symporter, SSS family